MLFYCSKKNSWSFGFIGVYRIFMTFCLSALYLLQDIAKTYNHTTQYGAVAYIHYKTEGGLDLTRPSFFSLEVIALCPPTAHRTTTGNFQAVY